MKKTPIFLILASLVILVSLSFFYTVSSSEDPISEINNNLEYIENITKIAREEFDLISASLSNILEYQENILALGSDELNIESLFTVNEYTVTIMNSIKEGKINSLLITAVEKGEISEGELDPVLYMTSLVLDKTNEISSKINEIQNPDEGEPDDGEPDGGGSTTTPPPEPEFTCSTNVYGYAWSPNVGWINMCGVSYDLANITNNTIPLEGAAWSPNVGWVVFDDTNEGPLGGSHGPRLDLANGNISGWAKVWSMETDLSQGTNYDKESSDWADGWINFSGSAVNNNGSYGVNCDLDTGDCNGYAWGDDVTGWINFSGAHGVQIDPIKKTSLDLFANKMKSVTVAEGDSVNLTWVGANLIAGSCELFEDSNSIGSPSLSADPISSPNFVNQIQNTGPLNNITTPIDYEIYCYPDPATGVSGQVTSSATVTVVNDLCPNIPNSPNGPQEVLPNNTYVDPVSGDCLCVEGFTLSPQYICVSNTGGFKIRIPWFIER
jgi:hypothetical protein